jgi:ribosome-associated protein
MLQITPALFLDESELKYTFTHNSGPGGQNINKVETAVQLRFNIWENKTLPSEVKSRLVGAAGKRLTDQGEILIEARRYRSQQKNREDATRRLVELIRRAAQKPVKRIKTQPSVSAKAARVNDKKHRGEVKRIRKYNPKDWE